MAQLITKFIRYPNEREAWGETGNPTEQSLKNCIIDIHNYLVDDLGLTESEDSGQLDLGNIPNLGIKDKFDASTTSRWTTWSYGYKMYEFNDPLQTEFPIMLRLEFQMKDFSYNSDPSYKSRIYFSVRVNVLSKTDGAGNAAPNSMNLSYEMCPATTHSSYNESHFSYAMSDSFGFYDNENGRLLLYICPNQRKGVTGYGIGDYTQMALYIERSKDINNNPNENYVITQCYNRGLWDTSETFRRFDTSFVNKAGIAYHNSGGSYIPLDGISANSSMRNNIFRTITVNPLTYELSSNNNMLSYFNKDIPLSGVIVKVKLSETETRDYITISPSNTGVYVSSTNYGHLIRIN